MSKRKYTHIQQLEGEILAMRQEGTTRQEIADRFGLSKEQIKNWINRYNRKQAKWKAGIVLRPKGRPRKDAAPRDVVREQAYEIERLQSDTAFWRAAACCDSCGRVVGNGRRVGCKMRLASKPPVSKVKNNGRNHVNSWFLPLKYQAKFFKGLF